MEKTMHYPILTELQLATKWNISNKTLGRWRATNQGPTWYKLFRHIRYREIAVIDLSAAVPNDFPPCWAEKYRQTTLPTQPP